MRTMLILTLHAVGLSLLWRWPSARATLATLLILGGQRIIATGERVLDSLPDVEMSEDAMDELEAELLAEWAVRNGHGPI